MGQFLSTREKDLLKRSKLYTVKGKNIDVSGFDRRLYLLKTEENIYKVLNKERQMERKGKSRI